MPRPFFSSAITIASTLAILWQAMPSHAQAPAPDYEVINTTQGLSQGFIFDLLQDKEGFIWVATKNGLNRYDGYDFKVFSNDPYNAYTLSSNTIVKLFEDSKGLIWAGTEDAGLNIYDKKSGRFYRVAHDVANPASLSGNSIRSFVEMPDGRMMVAIKGAGIDIVSLPGDFFEKGQPPLVTRLALPGATPVYAIGKDSTGRIFTGGMDGSVYEFSTAGNNFSRLSNAQLLNSAYFTKGQSIMVTDNYFLWQGAEAIPLFDQAHTPAGNMVFKPNAKLWENHHREISFYDVSKWQAGKPLSFTEHLPVATRIIYPFIIDRSGILWSGSVGYGLRKYSIANSKFTTALAHQSIRWILPASNNHIVLGDFAYGWRSLVNDSVEDNTFRKIPSVTQIDNLIISRTGDYYIKSDNSGYYKYNPLSGQLVAIPGLRYYYGEGDKEPMLEDSKGDIWCTGLGGKLARFRPRDGSIDSFSININAAKPLGARAPVTALYEDKQGIYWVGTQEGFARFSFTAAAAPAIQWFNNKSSTRNSLNYNNVSCFMDDPAQPARYLWICTKGGGLNRLDKTTGDFFHLTSKDGLPDDVVYGILADDAGNIWGSTNNGIFCLLAKTVEQQSDSTGWDFRNFTKAYGLQDDEFNTLAYARLPNGNMAFGGVNGLNIFNPKEILSTGFTPNVFITSILINNLPVTAGDDTKVLHNTIEASDNITLSYLQDILTLEFSSLDFTAPPQNKFRYQLMGIDNNWVESGTRRTATYLHLPSGTYTFKVQGSNSQGIWSNQISTLQITVLPPWWRSWWAYLLYGIVLVLIARAYFLFTVNRAKLRQQLSFEKQEAKRVKEMDTAKTQLYTNITHEFRTPLTVILGMARQVISKPQENLGGRMQMIVHNGENLLKLVNEMLDLSKLEAGNMQLELVNGDVVGFLRYIVESFHSLAESQQKQFHFLASLDTLYAAYDPEKIRRIIANLLSNALKFTPEKGNVYISVNATPSPADVNTSLLTITVKDTGIGIPESQLPHIFDRFYQLDNSLTRKADGTGIGLSLTKELVKLMDGEITVKSPPVGASRGTEFIVVLPLQKNTGALEENSLYTVPANEMIPATARNSTNGNGELHMNSMYVSVTTPTDSEPVEKKLILLVEDNADVVAYTASCLPDYKLAVAHDGREGLAMAAELVPDLVITDVMMPFMDGFELCRRLRSDAHSSHIPVIMLTAKIDMDSKLEGLRQGADVYLEKPFHREELLLRIKKLLELRHNLQQYYLNNVGLAASNAAPADTVAGKPAIDTTEDAFVRKVREAIEKHLSDGDFTVEQLCKLVFMSHSQLHRKLDALTGYSPNKFIRIVRLSKAKELLKHPDNSIATVAMDCGYNDPGYFGRIFKQEYGVTPQAWRNSVSQR